MTVTISVKGSALPADRVSALLVTEFKLSRKGGNNVIDLPGRELPVVAYHPTRGRAGSFSVLLAGAAEAAAFDLLMKRSATFTLTDSDQPFYNLNFAVDQGGYRVELHEAKRRFVGTVEVVEQ